MSNFYPTKTVPKNLAVFGGGGRINSHTARYVRYKAPDLRLRLLGSSEKSVDSIRLAHPEDEAMVANYFDPESLDRALDGIDAALIVTPSGLDEELAMGNFVDAARRAGTLKHIVRLVGYVPESTPDRIPAELRAMGGDGDQHYIAKAVLQKSGLPVTFVNLAASLFDNYMITAGPIRATRTLVWPQRHVPVMDVRDLGEVIARIFLSDDARHIGAFHTVNNGYDYLTTDEFAEVMSNAWATPIKVDTSWESFEREYGAIFKAKWGRDIEALYRFEHCRYEFEHALWCLNNFAETILERRPNTLHSWLQEHQKHFLPED